jgi:hypothetical protein
MTHNSDDVPRAEPENIPHGRSMALLSFSRSLSLSVCVVLSMLCVPIFFPLLLRRD